MGIEEKANCIMTKVFSFTLQASNIASIIIQINFSKVMNKVALKISELSKKSKKDNINMSKDLKNINSAIIILSHLVPVLLLSQR